MGFLVRFKSPPAPGPSGELPPQPDQAWKALSITNEWIRHADSKTGVTLAFAGATSAALFNLVKDEKSWTCVLIAAVVTCVGALLFTAGFGCAALFPRTKRQSAKGTDADEDSVNLLFFGDIAGHYNRDQPSYLQVLALLTSDPARLTRQIAAQIHENAHIATVKFKHVNRSVFAEIVAVGAVGLVAVVVAAGF